MSKESKKRTKFDEEIDIGQFIKTIFIVISSLILIWVSYLIVKTYNIKQKNLIKKSSYIYLNFQKAILDIYKEQGYLFKEDEEGSNFCSALAKKFTSDYDCSSSLVGYKNNFKIKGIEIYGLEKQPYHLLDGYVLDFFFDVNGSKEPNAIGEDRIPLRIHSKGVLAGRLTPLNCKMEDYKDYEIPYADICQGRTDIDFLAQTVPFSFDVVQIGGKGGKSRLLNRNIPFLRADCIAFGGELMNDGGFCEARQYNWLQSCYDEYTCSIELNNSKKF